MGKDIFWNVWYNNNMCHEANPAVTAPGAMWRLVSLLLLVILKHQVSGVGVGSDAGSINTPEATRCLTNMTVVSHVFMKESPEEKEPKNEIAEVHTYAKLEEDLKANLGSSFTVCSSVSSPMPSKQMFFSLLGQNGDFLAAGFFSSFHEIRGPTLPLF